MTYNDYLLYKLTQRRDQGHLQHKRSHEVTSQIPGIFGNCRKINVVKNFKISAFCDIIHPFVLPKCVGVVINCLKLLSTHFL